MPRPKATEERKLSGHRTSVSRYKLLQDASKSKGLSVSEFIESLLEPFYVSSEGVTAHTITKGYKLSGSEADMILHGFDSHIEGEWLKANGWLWLKGKNANRTLNTLTAMEPLTAETANLSPKDALEAIQLSKETDLHPAIIAEIEALKASGSCTLHLTSLPHAKRAASLEGFDLLDEWEQGKFMFLLLSEDFNYTPKANELSPDELLRECIRPLEQRLAEKLSQQTAPTPEPATALEPTPETINRKDLAARYGFDMLSPEWTTVAHTPTGSSWLAPDGITYERVSKNTWKVLEPLTV